MKHLDIHDLLKNTGSTTLQLCKAHNLTHAKLAELAGLSDCQISKVINNKVDPRKSTIIKIADVFGLL